MKSNPKLLAFLVVSSSAAIGLLAATTASDELKEEFPQAVQFDLGDKEFAPGDNITIEGLRGTTAAIQPGGTYCVTGTYTLNSQDEADLSFFATTTNKVLTPFESRQTMHVMKGTGAFLLVKKMTEDGYLHVSFYSRRNGQGFGGVYFGQGQWVLRDKHFSYTKTGTQMEEHTMPHEEVSFTGPNKVLFDYLGNPVAPPSSIDPAYTKEGLTSATRTAAQNAGISLLALEIDDSEFPFLVGVVFADPGDKQKFKEQIGQLPAYSFSGGVGGDTSYAMNLVPYKAFPRDSGQRIYRRMMLREAVLYDKITTGPLVASVAPATPETPSLSYTLTVHPEIKRAFHGNDSIEIRSITGTAPKFQTGGTYRVVGTCHLDTIKNATLCLGNTAKPGSQAIMASTGSAISKPLPNGTTDFDFTFTLLRPGMLHVTIYDMDNHDKNDNAYAGIYLGDVAVRR
ncbi:MAG TPA: hypothetical protein VFE51_02725 [Verrucomicrobiae bacterium]|nr:hypothetical protein [Verrucomicrobiae bacterium]